jgi:hypothetical protein
LKRGDNNPLPDGGTRSMRPHGGRHSRRGRR